MSDSGKPAHPAGSRRVDPDGRAALFSIAQSAAQREGMSGEEIAFEAAEGRDALFSVAGHRPGTVTLTCESCHRTTRVDLVRLAKMHFPFYLWFPWRTHSRLLVCPACEHRSWLRVGWFE